ncbi:MAG: prephenate dehydratase domain-containing protein [Alphaproteobacteria bacterium]|nr:prephenate dehydratase domain-containing protein [Alphaproteobacteria bacterium]
MSSNIDAEHSIAFMGVEGANADLACRRNYPYMKTLAFHSFEEVFAAVAGGKAKYGMVPIENSQAGRVAEIHNLLPRTNLHIVAEHIQPIEHHLYGVSGASLASVTDVYSHHQGLLQCRSFIGEHRLTTHIHDNTATAARDVAQWGDKTKGAICSELAGELYQLTRLAENIQDAEDNETLFVVLANEGVDPNPEDGMVLTSLFFSLRNIPAALYKALGGFATNGVNMLKLESYIRAGANSSAQFFMTFEGHPSQRGVQLALEELGFFTQRVNLLGVYPADSRRTRG